MSAAKMRSIVARMQSDLRPPQLAEGFHEIHVCPSGEPERAEAALRRLSALCQAASDDREREPSREDASE